MPGGLRTKAIQQKFRERMDETELLNCMRCGFCLPTCPTYIQSGKDETQSPRGRIALMKAVVDGLMEPNAQLEQTLNECLGCRACEPVCPSGVKYGHLLEEARDIINQNKTYSLPVRAVRRLVFKGLFPHPSRIRRFVSVLGWYQRSGLRGAVRKSGFFKLLPTTLSTMEKVLPEAPRYRDMADRPESLRAEGVKCRTVGFFSGCLMDTLFLETNRATEKLLQMTGCDVVVPKAQHCCGALHGHAGEKDQAKELAKKNIEAFERADVDYIITNAGGCGAFLVDYDHLLKDDPEWAERAAWFASKIKDISAVLVELGFHECGNLKLSEQVVTYQDSCHLRNVQGTSRQPRQLIQAIEGIEYVEMKDADRCCGSAGIYNIVHSELSMRYLDDKMIHAKETKASTIVTANPGCLMQMKLGIEREGLSERVRAVHLVDLLLEAVRTRDGRRA
jgi:glycolate oxidase iron-sulfur subunit